MKNHNQRFATVLLILAAGCGDDATKISTTRVRPPVQESLPANLLTSGSFALTTTETDYSKTCQTDATLGDLCQTYTGSKRLRCIVKNRLFCKGPTEVLSLLDSLDGRLAEIETRSGEGEVSCISGAGVDLSGQIAYPGSSSLTSKFQCKDSTVGMGFGSDDAGTWYVRVANGASASSFAVESSGSVRGYLWLPTKDGSFSQSTGLLNIAADRANKTLEFTGGGVGFGFCGIHFKSNSTHIYLTMNPDGTGGSCDYDSNGTTDASDWVDACLDATTLYDAYVANCSGLKTFSLATLGRDQSTGSGRVSTWEKAAPLTDSTPVRFEMKDYLLEIFNKASTFEGVSEFKTE